MARIAVLEFEQTPASAPVHYISKTMAEKFRACYHHGRQAVSVVDDRTLWIRVKVSFRKLKEWLKDGETRGIRDIPSKLPPIELPGIWFDDPLRPFRPRSENPFAIELASV